MKKRGLLVTPRRVSLREVARLAGVSSGTASRVLSGSAYPVSEPTSARVREAAEALGYVTDFAARALVTGRSALVGAIVHDITDPYFSGVVRGLQDEAVAEGLVVLVGNDDRDAVKLESYLTMMLSQKPAGVVLVGGQVRDPAKSLRVFQAVERLRAEGVPVAAVGRYELDIPHVCRGRCLPPRVRRRPSASTWVTRGSRSSAACSTRRRSRTAIAATRGAEPRRMPVDDELVVQTPMSLAGGSQAADDAHGRARCRSRPSFAATDEVAFGVISGLRGRGLRVPEDVSVVGMDDVPMAAHADPPLTTIHVPARELGCSAWHLLSAIRDGVDVPEAQCVPFDLVVRDSTAPAHGAATSRTSSSSRQAGRGRAKGSVTHRMASKRTEELVAYDREHVLHAQIPLGENLGVIYDTRRGRQAVGHRGQDVPRRLLADGELQPRATGAARSSRRRSSSSTSCSTSASTTGTRAPRWSSAR